MPLGILEILTRVGEQHLQVQTLDQSMRGAQSIQKGAATEIRFGTEAVSATELMSGGGRFGFIVWCPRETVMQIGRDYRAGSPASGEAPVSVRPADPVSDAETQFPIPNSQDPPPAPTPEAIRAEEP